MKLLPILNEIIDKKELILLLKSMDYSEKEAKNELKDHLNRLKTFQKH